MTRAYNGFKYRIHLVLLRNILQPQSAELKFCRKDAKTYSTWDSLMITHLSAVFSHFISYSSE